MSVLNFTLPDVGEGLTEAEIVEWRVAPGDTVSINQVLVEIETAKSLVELPSPFVGVVGAILVEVGTTVDVGTVIITIVPAEEPAAVSPAPAAAPAAVTADAGAGQVPAAHVTELAGAALDTGSTITAEEPKVLVGRGAAPSVPTRRRRGSDGAAPHASIAPPAIETPRPAAAAQARAPRAASAGPVIAKPPIRKLAKDLGVDLALVEATGPVGDVTREDVLRGATQASVFRNIQTPEWPSDREEHIPVKGVRKAIAQAMVGSAFTAPHVSLFVDVDATRTMEFVKRLKSSTDFAGVRVSPMLIMAKAMIWAVRRNPTVNSVFTDQEIIIKHYVNLGIAAATPRGLIVPNVKEAQDMSLLELARALETLTLTARDGKTTPADQAGGTITITNIGVFGMDTGTPILNSGEAGIVALGTIKPKPWVVDGEVRVRQVTTIGASFDHRVVDGDVASRFLADVASIIEEPALLLE
ncbi:dihydrolipoamide acetyltransferase family protein [Cryobacterium sp. 10I1]|uniref:dihydrolipoamide acetyltransferase family protein n=1 Tax=unclassified Cryobacterium TaxID=2649013 RepID=UPI002AC9BE3E|nr:MULTISPECIES: dihydrolipoamide acetyltransferase family protein [unclassified Cryobacterium]MEB0001567.1 dihydrolipoamide acetyltransferase family protein [Cryobacterium sp. RTC2.1]MEB0286058.1 dihydrolipoamide acetyltransferase family protein [Cryobacterium sp. 10S3]MEB0306387.1 dihydrolipoamide acetyltransferase family protein [Cryobacterium sp. 10I1]WPX13518.1 dihydrolipoamide acetyltransferase family protein [Cryobacterium sp. 10S3]